MKPCNRRPADLTTIPEVPHAPPAAPPTLSQPSRSTYVPDATDALYDADVADAVERHSGSLDTLLYVRFAIQNLEFYEWKLGDRGWALS